MELTEQRTIAISRDVVFAALNDPEIQAWHKKTKRPIDPLAGPETGKLLEDLAKFFTQYKDVLK